MYLSFLPFQVLSSPSQTAVTSLPRMSGLWFTRPHPMDYHVWGQCCSLIKNCNYSQSYNSSFKMQCIQFRPPYQRKQSTETSASDCRHVCQPKKINLNKKRYNSYITDSVRQLYLIILHVMRFVFNEKWEFRNKLNWTVIIEGCPSKSDTIHTNIQITWRNLVDT